MKSTSTPKPIEGFQTQILEGENVLFHPTRNTIIHINQTGALAWGLCDRSRTVGEIVELLSTAYPEAREQIAEDAPHTIHSLVRQGTLEIE
ncbi:MAG: PqqD family protein [Anaerolineales bacterium]